MKDQFLVRYTNKHDSDCTIVVYATSMYGAKETAMQELGEYVKKINEITNCTFARELINNQSFD